MKLGQRITDPFSKERGEVVMFNCHGFSLRMADGSKVYVRNADLAAARELSKRRQNNRKLRPPKPLVQDGPDAELSRLAKANGVSYETALQAMREG